MRPRFNAAVLFLPKLFVAFLLVIVGFVAARFLRERVERSATRMDLAEPIGPITEGAIIAVFTTTALAHSACPSWFRGAGVRSGQPRSRWANCRRTHHRRLFKVGQKISVGDYEGKLDAFESAATLLRTERGAVVRIPNNVLLHSIVTIHGDPSTELSEVP